jgi:hypothetical protein
MHMVTPRGGKTLKQGELQRVAGISIFRIELVHKSVFALSGHAVPSSAFAVFANTQQQYRSRLL